jgi:hypothetical protein
MRESTTYQAIVREERVAGVQRMLVRLGAKRFGPLDTATVALFDAVQDIDRLESLGERILESDLQGWDDLI